MWQTVMLVICEHKLRRAQIGAMMGIENIEQSDDCGRAGLPHA